MEAWQSNGSAQDDFARELSEIEEGRFGKLYVAFWTTLTVIALSIALVGSIYAVVVYVFLGGNFPWLP
ncbi:MAG: hypothetical protein JXA57_05135 [Armatimonadetes bacterium]|nr:hypothetical protein [Armatimonadota bacterium]